METIKKTHKHKSVQNSNPKKTQMQTQTTTQTQRQRQTHSNVKINSCDWLPHKHTCILKWMDIQKETQFAPLTFCGLKKSDLAALLFFLVASSFTSKIYKKRKQLTHELKH